MRVVKTGTPEVDRVLEEFRKELRRERGVYLAASLEALVPYRFTHALGRTWSHWFVTRSTIPAPVYEVNVATTNRKNEIWLESTAAGDIEIFLF